MVGPNLGLNYMVFPVFFLPLYSRLSVHNCSVVVSTSKSPRLSLFFYHLLLFCYLQPFSVPLPFWYQLNHLLKALLWHEKYLPDPLGSLSGCRRRFEDLGRGTDWDRFPQGLVTAHVSAALVRFPSLLVSNAMIFPQRCGGSLPSRAEGIAFPQHGPPPALAAGYI